jgi:glycosyltransferase involved in cell wall biosynthesis
VSPARQTPERRPLRVMLLTSSLHYGGTERQVVELAKHLDRRRFAPIVCCLDGTRTLFDLNPSPTPLVMATRRSRLDLMPFLIVGWTLRRRRVDVVHSFLLDAEIIGRIMGRLTRVPVVVGSERNSDYPENIRRERLQRLTRRLVDLLIANSHAGRRYATESLGFDPRRVVVVHNGVDTERFRPGDARAVRERLGIPPGESVVGMFASFKEQKNHAMYFRVARQILNKRPATYFLCVGHTPSRDRFAGPYLVRLRGLLAELGLEDRMTMLVDRHDVDQLYIACDVTVLTSQREGTPNVVLESMAAGVPVVATDVADNALILDEASGGKVVRLDDDAAMAARVCEMLDDPSTLHEAGTRARRAAIERFSLPHFAEKIGTLYENAYVRTVQARGNRRELPAR